MLEVHAPNHCTRKSRYVNATSIRWSVFDPKNTAGEAVSGAGETSAGMESATKLVVRRRFSAS
jgi:hypothetical protein